MDLKDNHPLHATAIGGTVYYFTNSPLYGITSAIGWYMYMQKYGHTFPNPLKIIS
jgi:hypothetical protein